MKAPLFAILSLVLPAVAGGYGYYLVRTAKGATNMGEALGPYFAMVMLLCLAAVIGEVSAVISLVRGERLGWLAWAGLVANAAPLLWVALLLTGNWK